MPTYEITSPDGGVFEVTAPEGASEADIMSYAQANFPEGVAQERGANIAAIQAAGLSKPEEMFQMAGQGAGFIGDVAGEAMKGAYDIYQGDEGYPTVGGAIGSGLAGLGGAIGSIPTLGGGTVGEAALQGAQYVGEKYGEFKEGHPRAAGNIEAAANIAMVSPVLGQGENVIRAMSKSQIAKMSADDVRKTAGALFKKADAQGGQLKPEFMDDFVEEINKLTPQTDVGIALQGDTEVTKVIQALTESRGKTLTLEGMKDADEILGNLAYKHTDDFGVLNSEGRAVMEVQAILRDKIKTAPPEMFMSGKEAFETIKDARKFWAASLRLRDVERIMEKSVGAAQPSTVIKNGFRQLKRSKKFRQYTPEEQFAIKKAAKDGSVGSILKLTSSGMLPIVALAAGGGATIATGGTGALAAIPALAVQQASKAGIGAMQAAKGRAVSEAIKEGVFAPPIQPPISPLAGSLVPAGAASITQETLSQRAKRILDARKGAK